jgi:hypothetical protein
MQVQRALVKVNAGLTIASVTEVASAYKRASCVLAGGQRAAAMQAKRAFVVVIANDTRPGKARLASTGKRAGGIGTISKDAA